ncbi:hypothetical protein ACROYT_G042657 [Oculina patagonica]
MVVELNNSIVVVVELNNRIVVVVEFNNRIVVVVVVVELNNRIVVVVVVVVELNNRIVVVVVVVVELNNRIVVVVVVVVELNKRIVVVVVVVVVVELNNRTAQNLMAAPVIPEMQRLRNNMDGLLSRNDLGEDEKARQYMQLQNRFLTYKHQLNSIPEATKWAEPQEKKQISTTENLLTVPTPSPELATVPATPVQAPDPQVITSKATSTPLPPSPPPSILTPPPTVEISPPKKRKRPQIRLVNYLDDKPKRPSRQSRRLHRTSPYKYSKGHEDDS